MENFVRVRKGVVNCLLCGRFEVRSLLRAENFPSEFNNRNPLISKTVKFENGQIGYKLISKFLFSSSCANIECVFIERAWANVDSVQVSKLRGL